MVLKERAVPLKLYGLGALEKRLGIEDENYSYIRRKRLSAQAGVGGEEILDRVFLNNKFNHEYRIIHDLHLSANSNFQIDTVFFTPSYVVVLEMKNFAGRVRFEENPRQMIRTMPNGQQDAYDCPGVQLEKNSMLLKEWLFDRGFDLPIYGAVVFARSSTQFENTPPFKVLFPSELPVYLRKIHNPGRELDSGTFQMLAHELANSHVVFNPFPICKTFRIPESSVMTGVECKHCAKLGMVKLKKGWSCLPCGFVDRNAHQQAIVDWFMLFGGKLTNKECRRFLQIEKAQTATRILESSGLISKGERKGRVYSMDLLEFFNKESFKKRNR
ncbi:nuclease-related domain-containing protein [Chungangia koreensis]|uniref:Nuclease-related domain-containing protein n=1 Tax=Chungangia koreensis TaxID=752657 RepID=A0ABV8X452_9LACT